MEESKRLTPLVDCPVEKTIQLISNKWKVLIIRELLFEKRRFNELQRLIPGISPKVLTQNLKEMIGGTRSISSKRLAFPSDSDKL